MSLTEVIIPLSLINHFCLSIGSHLNIITFAVLFTFYKLTFVFSSILVLKATDSLFLTCYKIPWINISICVQQLTPAVVFMILKVTLILSTIIVNKFSIAIKLWVFERSNVVPMILDQAALTIRLIIFKPPFIQLLVSSKQNASSILIHFEHTLHDRLIPKKLSKIPLNFIVLRWGILHYFIGAK